MKVGFAALGCRLNEAELETWTRQFRALGHGVVEELHRADVIVVNSCAVTGEATKKSRKLVAQVRRQNAEAPIVLTGCFAELEPSRAAALAGVTLVIGNRDKDALPTQLLAALPGLCDEREPAAASAPTAPAGAAPTAAEIASMKESAALPTGGAARRTRAFVKIQDGCRNRCAFCIVTVARGPERSRSLGDLVTEVNDLAARGHREVVLTGVHIGGYGADLGLDLRTVVRTLLRDTDIPRLRLSSLEPWDLPEGFFRLWENRRLLPHLHLPAQSGCDATLRRMHRRSTVAGFRALLAEARALIPALTVTTDIITGFPGETAEEWAATRDFLRELRFAHLHAFTFSPRAGTKAASLPDPIAPQVSQQRRREALAIAASCRAAHLAEMVGTTRAVLWESPVTSAADTGARGGVDTTRCWLGHTDNYLRVTTTQPTAVDLHNAIIDVQITGVDGDGAGLTASEVRVPDAPRPRLRSLPVIA